MVVPIEWREDKLRILDQRELPYREAYIDIYTPYQLAEAIKSMAIRGAPLLGVAAAWGVYLSIAKESETDREAFFKALFTGAELIKNSRPTAINIANAVNRALEVAVRMTKEPLGVIKDGIYETARKIQEENVAQCLAIAEAGVNLIKNNNKVLTICNTGRLATGAIGTALGILFLAYQRGVKFSVFVSETRPLLQGSRITAWELQREGIPVTLITDNMVGYAMKKGMIDIVIVGADRITANGDTANKIGTYTLAILAHNHKIPFYVAAPSTSFDLTLSSGDEIPIEERSPDEIRFLMGKLVAPRDIPVWNPAFDVTPVKYITGIITEKGIIEAPSKAKIKDFLTG